MLTLEKWGEKRAKNLVVFSHYAALCAEPLYEICAMSRIPEHRERFIKPREGRSWIAHYNRQHHLFMLTPSLAEGLFNASGEEKTARNAAATFQAMEEGFGPGSDGASRKESVWRILQVNTGHDMEDAQHDPQLTNALYEQVYRAHVAGLKEILSQRDSIAPALMTFFETNEEMKFLLLVAVPCWLEHGVSASILFDEARKGDFESLRKLLSIDPHCLEDERVRREHSRLMESSDDFRRRLLAKASSMQPLRELTCTKVKILIGAYIYKVWKDFYAKGSALKAMWPEELTVVTPKKLRVRYPDIHSLFDAAYHDQHGDGVVDPDLEMSSDAFQHAVDRKLEFWSHFHVMVLPDKFRP